MADVEPGHAPQPLIKPECSSRRQRKKVTVAEHLNSSIEDRDVRPKFDEGV